mgnify:CR=1 FL=1
MAEALGEPCGCRTGLFDAVVHRDPTVRRPRELDSGVARGCFGCRHPVEVAHGVLRYALLPAHDPHPVGFRIGPEHPRERSPHSSGQITVKQTDGTR